MSLSSFQPSATVGRGSLSGNGHSRGHGHGLHAAAISRPQVGIERLPTRRLTNEPRESMNCKSCRKRKIKCNRLRPACEACQVFQCPCVYDAIPKKRGPKTDVLEALLKRVDGLEQKLMDSKKPGGDDDNDAAGSNTAPSAVGPGANDETASAPAGIPGTAANRQSQQPIAHSPESTGSMVRVGEVADTMTVSPLASASESGSIGVQADALLDTYFHRFHGKPFHILDESTIRQRLQLNQVPAHLVDAIFAVGARYTQHPSGYQSAVKLSEELAARARAQLDVDEPSVEALQTLLLLVTAFTASGKGKKAYMLLTSAIGMAMALQLHREVDLPKPMTPTEREMRRRLLWSCYLLDRFLACGSKRSCLLADKAILLRLPSWSPGPALHPIEGAFFSSGSNLQYWQGSGQQSQGSSGMLIDMSRILGVTNRYLAAGGVKGDSHFPWHTLSNLSRIRHDLDVWASGAQQVLTSVNSLFGQPDSTVLVLSKLIYHLVHCLIYRPFLPIDLAELDGHSQHQSWQIEATNLCFQHANAIAELVEMGKQAPGVEWPAFVGYCICTAATVHVHGAHYNRRDSQQPPHHRAMMSANMGATGFTPGMNTTASENNNNMVMTTDDELGAGAAGLSFGIDGQPPLLPAITASAEFLSREMQQLSELRYAWASIQHQRETLQRIYAAHSRLVRSLGNGDSLGYSPSPAFQLEDFFDRYTGMGDLDDEELRFDAANLGLSDVVADFTADTYGGHDLYAPRGNGAGQRQDMEPISALSPSSMAALDATVTTGGLRPLPINGTHALREDGGLLPPVLAAAQRAGQEQGQENPSLYPRAHLRNPVLEASTLNAPVPLASPGRVASVSQTPAASGPGSFMRDSIEAAYGYEANNSAGGTGQTPSGISPSLRPRPPPGDQQNPHNETQPASGQNAFDPMLGQLPTNAMPSPAAWQSGGDSAQATRSGTSALSHGGSSIDRADGIKEAIASQTSASNDKDPFLSLLEQLAENDLDFFLAGSSQSNS